MERFNKRESKAVEKVIRSGKLSRFFTDFNGGEQVQAFEKEFAEYMGVEHAITVSNGTVAVEIAIASLTNTNPGDEIIVTPLTFIATATAILRNNLKPVFVDINPLTLNMDETQVEAAITPKTKAIMSVSLLGKPANIQLLSEIADDHDIFLIEDAAQALGADALWKYCCEDVNCPHREARKIGTCGHIGTFSFQESKTITTLGEGGMIVTNSDTLADTCRHIRNHGNTYGYQSMKQPCTNARMTEAQAAFGRVQLEKLDAFIKIQQRNAETFLFYVDWTKLNPVYNNNPNPAFVGGNSTFYLIPMRINKDFSYSQQQIIEKLKPLSKGVPGENIGYYKKLVYENPVFVPFKPKDGCPVAEKAIHDILLFDIHRWNKTPQDMIAAAEFINKALQNL